MVTEAGVFGLVSVGLFIGGVLFTVTVGRARGNPFAVALPVGFFILAAGQLGQGLGQRLVRDAVERVAPLADKVALLNLGAGEAAANLVLSGACALLLGLVAGAVALASRKTAP